MDRFVTLSLVMLAASQAQVFAQDNHNYANYTALPGDFLSNCPDACHGSFKMLADCLLNFGASVCECDETYVPLLNACYLCAVDSNAAGDTISGFENFNAKAAQASLDDLFDTCQQFGNPITQPVFGTDVFDASSASAPASTAAASSEAVSSAATASTTSSTPATPASTGSAPAGSALAGNATASAPQPTKSGSARGVSSVTFTAAACAVVGVLATFFL